MTLGSIDWLGANFTRRPLGLCAVRVSPRKREHWAVLPSCHQNNNWKIDTKSIGSKLSTWLVTTRRKIALG